MGDLSVETVAVALFLLLAVVVSGAFARMSPVPLPLPLVQIALGSIIASVANLGVALKPDIFFLLFLPPLLFLDGWRIPKQGLFRDKGTILELALGLVVAEGECGHYFQPSKLRPVPRKTLHHDACSSVG